MVRYNESIWGTWPGPAKSARTSSVPLLTLDPCAPRPSYAGPYVSPQLERAIAARWQIWVPWVCMYLLRQRQADPTVSPSMDGTESRRLRERHTEHILDLMREGISMRTIRRHRLDDPRITDEVRAMLVDAAKARQSKAWYRRPAELRAEEKSSTRMNLGPIVRNAAPKDADNEIPERCSPMVVLDPQALKEAIQTIRRLVCERFYLGEMRDPELTVRTNRRAYVLPRQLAMYVVRQLTGASLQEIGREFGGRHHTTVLHAISKIEAMRGTDEALNRTITRLVDAVAAKT